MSVNAGEASRTADTATPLRRASKQQQVTTTSMSPMIISVDNNPSSSEQQQQQQKEREKQKQASAARVFQQQQQQHNDDVDSQAMSVHVASSASRNNYNLNNRQMSASTAGSSISMVLPPNSNNNNNNNNNNHPNESTSKNVIHVDLLKKVDLSSIGNRKAFVREDSSLVAVAMAHQQRNINNHQSSGANNNNNNRNNGVADADLSMISVALRNNAGSVTRSEVTIGNASRNLIGNSNHANNQSLQRGMALGVATLTDQGALFARVATVAGIDGLAHFEKDDYERFVEDRQRAILYGTLPNKLEDAIVNAAFSAFIGKLKQLELSQRSKQQTTTSNTTAVPNAAAIAVQHRLEAIDDGQDDFVVYLNDHSRSNLNQQPVGRQAGGQNQQQLFRRTSRPQTRGMAQQGQKGPSTKQQNALLTPSKQPNNNSTVNVYKQSSMLAMGTTMLTGQRGTGSNSNNTNGRNSTLPQQQQQQQQTVSVAYKKVYNNNNYHGSSSVAPSGSNVLFPFPPPSNIIYGLSRKDYDGSKLSLPVISATGTTPAKVPPQQLKIVNVNFRESRQLKVDDSAAAPNH